MAEFSGDNKGVEKKEGNEITNRTETQLPEIRWEKRYILEKEYYPKVSEWNDLIEKGYEIVRVVTPADFENLPEEAKNYIFSGRGQRTAAEQIIEELKTVNASENKQREYLWLRGAFLANKEEGGQVEQADKYGTIKFGPNGITILAAPVK